MNETLTFRTTRPIWDLVVVGSRELCEDTRRVSLIGDDLEGFDFRPGQELVLRLPIGAERPERRRYTIAGFDPAELRLDLDVPVHGDPLAARWATAARVGDPIRAERPRD